MSYLNGAGLAHFLAKLEQLHAAVYATKSELEAARESAVTAYHVKGTVASAEDLPASGNHEGDVWNVGATLSGDNYVWTGEAWDKLGGTIDLSPYALDGGVVHLAGSEIVAGQKAFLETIIGTADQALKDGSGNVIAETYATKAQTATSGASGLMSAADKSKLDGIAPGSTAVSVSAELQSGVKIGTVTVNGVPTVLYCANLPQATTDVPGGVTLISDAQIDALFS